MVAIGRRGHCGADRCRDHGRSSRPPPRRRWPCRRSRSVLPGAWPGGVHGVRPLRGCRPIGNRRFSCEPSDQDRSSRPADTDTPSAHAVSIRELSTTNILFIGASLALGFLASDRSFSASIRLTNREKTRTTKTPAVTAALGIEPRTPAPDLV